MYLYTDIYMLICSFQREAVKRFLIQPPNLYNTQLWRIYLCVIFVEGKKLTLLLFLRHYESSLKSSIKNLNFKLDFEYVFKEKWLLTNIFTFIHSTGCRLWAGLSRAKLLLNDEGKLQKCSNLSIYNLTACMHVCLLILTSCFKRLFP